MSDVEWDADDYEPPTAAPPVPTDKWDGEDEEDEIKDNWDDEDEEKEKAATTDTTVLLVKKKKKKIADIIAEKEAKQTEENEKRKREAEERAKAKTAEGILAEKMRLQKIQEDSDLQLANELLGTNSNPEEDTSSKLLDNIDLSSNDGLTLFRKALISKIRTSERLEKRPFFITFVEDVCRDLCQNLETEEVKRVSSVLTSLYNEKVKAGKPKSKKKAAGKAKLNVGQGALVDDVGNDFSAYTEYDDFI
ncbi:eukaryotic translation initiation factor 3 subunit J isoform X2 [Procambarus clarkii]|uniref:eukaryotic translation initiation factor 3 subunit J isoform X2 n=1 Tax=Procambarus clarkii TaxID=6728 RepID=UPI001E6715ED|nr:eukaryotic translation initiation factor 3 subunit J-like isoform X2 [Procambarus clarkii]